MGPVGAVPPGRSFKTWRHSRIRGNDALKKRILRFAQNDIICIVAGLNRVIVCSSMDSP